ncbi:MAG: diphosphomevalonate decarboxylase [Anaerolineales bacterium]|nr:diphosphomevalonate decarboxylase [Anaerolineales bacterium]
MSKVVAVAHPNIAFIKYWGNQDDALRLPSNGSISMNLDGLHSQTAVEFSAGLAGDELQLDGGVATPEQTQRVSAFLDLVREMSGVTSAARVESQNNFPSGAGIASSSSAFAALALAASAAAGLELDEAALSRLARRGSGSASRSVPGGYAEWRSGDDAGSFAHSIAAAEHWELADCVAIISEEHKATGSTAGHALAGTSPLQAARLAGAPGRLDACRAAIERRDFATLAEVAELDCHLMHAVMMTSQPGLHYWLPASLEVMAAVRGWRAAGMAAFYTLDAGPNVHVLCPESAAAEVAAGLAELPGVLRVLRAAPGGPARLLSDP